MNSFPRERPRAAGMESSCRECMISTVGGRYLSPVRQPCRSVSLFLARARSSTPVPASPKRRIRRHDVTSGRNACAGRPVVLRGKERCERSASPRREDEAKTSFVRPFREKISRLSPSFVRAMSLLVPNARSHESPFARSMLDVRIGILGYKILARTRSVKLP